jgi:hypothetical protein
MQNPDRIMEPSKRTKTSGYEQQLLTTHVSTMTTMWLLALPVVLISNVLKQELIDHSVLVATSNNKTNR